MQTRHPGTRWLATLALTLALAGTAVAHTAGAAKPRMATDIPPEITTPDTVETRLGTLKFFDGMPDKDTVAKVYDNLDFLRGVEVFLNTMPGASLYAMREGLRSVGVDNQTVTNSRDAQGNYFDGGKNYKLRIPAKPPVKTFWSIVLYDPQTRSELQTDEQFPSIGSQKEGIQTNADGSVDVYFGPKTPTGKESNWIQTVPGKSWNTVLRLYGPLEPYFDKTWRPGDIEVVQ